MACQNFNSNDTVINSSGVNFLVTAYATSSAAFGDAVKIQLPVNGVVAVSNSAPSDTIYNETEAVILTDIYYLTDRIDTTTQYSTVLDNGKYFGIRGRVTYINSTLEPENSDVFYIQQDTRGIAVEAVGFDFRFPSLGHRGNG